MTPALRISATGMRAQQLRVDVIAHNLANVNTTGYKRQRVSFQEALVETLQGEQNVDYANATVLPPLQRGQGVRVSGILRVHTQGALEATGRALDLAIEGEGFFQVSRPDGSVAYTRDGTFNISDTGALVTTDGYALLPAIQVPADTTQLTISPSGVVSAVTERDGRTVELGRIELARFVNPAGLLSLGGNLLAATAASGNPISGLPQEGGFGRILQGNLEASNVEIVQEMVEMIAAQRAYEINAKAIRTAEDMEQALNDLVR